MSTLQNGGGKMRNQTFLTSSLSLIRIKVVYLYTKAIG